MSDPLTENYMTIFKISVWEQILGVQVFLVFDDEVGELEDRFLNIGFILNCVKYLHYIVG